MASMPIAAVAQTSGNAGIHLAQIQFNPDFFKRPDGSAIDVSRFAAGNPIHPGSYRVDVYLNGRWLGRDTVQFESRNEHVAPCLDGKLLARLNLDTQAFPPDGQSAIRRAVSGQCALPSDISGDFNWTFDLSELRLDLSIAQALLRREPRGTVSPDLWDDGVQSATVAYNASSFHSSGAGVGTSTYLGLDSGLNIGAWHLRQRSSMTWQTMQQQGYTYQNIATYVQHDIPSLRSQLTIGDAFTDGAVFDSFSVRGVNLGSDDRMLPDSSRGYAPLVRGVARSNARVTVTQNGAKLYETTVAPGPFEINDLYATGYGGNLQVNVTEADGSQSSFTVPYASVVQLIRPGILRYSATLGEYRNPSPSSRRERLAQGTAQYGFSNLLTGYAGVVASEGYQAALLGAAFNTPLGAVAMDATYAKASIPDVNDSSGESLRVSYSKFVPTTGTNLSVAAYRYASKGFWTMRDAFAVRGGRGEASAWDRPRGQLQITLNQNLGDRWGNVYLTGTSVSYWSRRSNDVMYQVGYSNVLRAFGTTMAYTIAASRQRDTLTGTLTTQVFGSIIVPLGSGQHAPMLSFNATQNSESGASQQLRLNGTALADNTLTYGLSADRSPGSTTGGGTIQYRAPYATLSASASGGGSFAQYSAGIQGAIVAHPGGLTLANYLGDTIGIVEAKGATGARITNSPGVRIDAFGYAVVPYLQPYQLNRVELDPKGIPLDISLDATSTQVAPRANSAVKIRFAATEGRSAIVTAALPDGKPLPFGATVTNASQANIGMVGQNSIIFARGIDEAGELLVTWGKGDDQRCTITYQVSPRPSRAFAYTHIKSTCVPDQKE